MGAIGDGTDDLDLVRPDSNDVKQEAEGRVNAGNQGLYMTPIFLLKLRRGIADWRSSDARQALEVKVRV